MLPVRTILAYFFFSMRGFIDVLGDGDVKYDFKTETVLSVKFAAADKDYPVEKMQKSPLSDMSYEDRKKLCIQVQEHASLQFLPNYDYYLFEAKPSEIDFEGRKDVQITGYCPTIPEAYLRVGDSPNQIVIMFEKTLGDLFAYKVESVKSISEAALDDETRKQLKEHFLFQLNNDNRWKLCIAAKRQFKHVVLGFGLIKAMMYQIIDSANGIINRVGIECPTVPTTLYLRLGQEDDQMLIMFVDVNDDIVV